MLTCRRATTNYLLGLYSPIVTAGDSGKYIKAPIYSQITTYDMYIYIHIYIYVYVYIYVYICTPWLLLSRLLVLLGRGLTNFKPSKKVPIFCSLPRTLNPKPKILPRRTPTPCNGGILGIYEDPSIVL